MMECIGKTSEMLGAAEKLKHKHGRPDENVSGPIRWFWSGTAPPTPQGTLAGC